ncbi:hypothetical protein KUCAC02_019555 [Chaenocephalus aceratus]|uniref:Uncharacterized protein n=1 Tax=Chaenocephalus aceratus TaxID=36190 RepID=A0ACB9VNQ1_CHAAC|nr:hypothetical protein KUCAC02_019555 [Chaenocephalus aceratus]
MKRKRKYHSVECIKNNIKKIGDEQVDHSKFIAKYDVGNVMPPKKPNKKAKVPLNESSGLSGVIDTQAAEENAMESGALQVNHSELSVLIRSIIREEIGAAFEKFQPQLDALKGELDSCCQKLGDMEEGITDMDCRVAILETANGNLMYENKEFKDKIERMEIQAESLIYV